MTAESGGLDVHKVGSSLLNKITFILNTSCSSYLIGSYINTLQFWEAQPSSSKSGGIKPCPMYMISRLTGSS